MDERKYPLMSDLNFDTMELTFTTSANVVLARAAQEAHCLGGDTPVDPSHILLALAALTDDFSVYKPLRELGFEFEKMALEMLEHYLMGSYQYQLRMSPLYDQALQEAAHSASLRSGAKMIGLSDLTIGVFASNSPIVLAMMKQRGITRHSVMTTMNAPDEFILRFIDVPAD